MKKSSCFFHPMLILSLTMVVWLGWGALTYRSTAEVKEKEDKPETIIIKIYDEVKEMGKREGEDFIKREFHFDLDGRRANREEHVLVFSYSSNGQQILSIQVTYYEDDKSQNFQGRAQDIKDINCLISENSAEIKECSFSQEELKNLLPKILEGIKKEKELLKLVRKSG
ncbi:MAG TPA: hypothetical protein VFG01_11125 [Acidobacteriota bacterium]|nr:hypothetical protein [Acidobacteriota bacterium]